MVKLAPSKDAQSGRSTSPSLITAAEISAKWSELRARISADEAAIVACRTDQVRCSPVTIRFLSIVDLGRNREGRARLGWVNRAVNMAIRPVSDWAQYGLADFWPSPLQTLSSGAGDCEDYAIMKYVALRELGIPPDDLRLVVVQDDKRDAGHVVVAVHYEQRWLILDNRTMTIVKRRGRSPLSSAICLGSAESLPNFNCSRRSNQRSIICPSRAVTVPSRASFASAARVSMKSSS